MPRDVLQAGQVGCIISGIKELQAAKCASVKQRDFWLGQAASVGRLNPDTYDDDESMDSLITVVPFGTGNEPPVKRRPAIKTWSPASGRTTT